jgi:AcrR family transcriptional regulator
MVSQALRLRRAAPSGRKSYHHGNLRQALIDAALLLAEERGAEGVSVREAARRVGVSSGAPFRHFASREALMTALAEQAMALFRIEIEAGQRRASADPRSRLGALGHSFIRWAFRFPTHFQIISSRHLIDFEGSATLGLDLAAVRALTVELIAAAQGVAPGNERDVMRRALIARALVYGLARMRVDGQFPQWDIPELAAEVAALDCVDILVELLASN